MPCLAGCVWISAAVSCVSSWGAFVFSVTAGLVLVESSGTVSCVTLLVPVDFSGTVSSVTVLWCLWAVVTLSSVTILWCQETTLVTLYPLSVLWYQWTPVALYPLLLFCGASELWWHYILCHCRFRASGLLALYPQSLFCGTIKLQWHYILSLCSLVPVDSSSTISCHCSVVSVDSSGIVFAVCCSVVPVDWRGTVSSVFAGLWCKWAILMVRRLSPLFLSVSIVTLSPVTAVQCSKKIKHCVRTAF